MRNIVRSLAVPALLAATLFGPTVGARELQSALDASAYVSVAFGGDRAVTVPAPHFGLRLDRGHERAEAQAVPLVQADFTSGGFHAALVQGLPLVRAPQRVQQDDGEAAGEAAADSGWGWGTWTLLGVTAAIGVVALSGGGDGGSEPAGNSGGGDGDEGGDDDVCVIGPALCFPGGLPLAQRGTGIDARVDGSVQAWLDAGTGQMGDLVLE